MENEAENKKCVVPAMFRYTWPGRDEQRVCIFHADQLAKISDAMNFRLQIIRLEPMEMLQNSQCHQRPLPAFEQEKMESG